MKSARFLVLISIVLLITSFNIYAFPTPDTGQTKCYNSIEIPCPASGGAFYGQDRNYTINLPSYTKIGSSGEVLPDNAASWAMVRDNVTGLIWENYASSGADVNGDGKIGLPEAIYALEKTSELR